MSSTAEKIKVMQACVEGHPMQSRNLKSTGQDTNWVDFGKLPSFNWNWEMCDYRVKPRAPREFIVYAHNGVLMVRWTYNQPEQGVGADEEVHVVEQLEKQK